MRAKAHGDRACSVWARLAGAVAICLALQLAGPAQAQDATASQRAFAATYMAALRSNDVRRLEALYHPDTLACIDPTNRVYFDALFAGDLQTGASLAGPYDAGFTPFSGPINPFGLPVDAFISLPKPTHVMQISAPTQDRHLVVMVVYLAPMNGAWGALVRCPSAKGVQILMRAFAKPAP